VRNFERLNGSNRSLDFRFSTGSEQFHRVFPAIAAQFCSSINLLVTIDL